MEGCVGSHFLGRVLREQGHEVRGGAYIIQQLSPGLSLLTGDAGRVAGIYYHSCGEEAAMAARPLPPPEPDPTSKKIRPTETDKAAIGQPFLAKIRSIVTAPDLRTHLNTVMNMRWLRITGMAVAVVQQNGGDIRLEIFGAEVVFIGQLRSLKRHVYRGSSNSEIESVR
jgi:hypothetical protein